MSELKQKEWETVFRVKCWDCETTMYTVIDNRYPNYKIFRCNACGHSVRVEIVEVIKDE